MPGWFNYLTRANWRGNSFVSAADLRGVATLLYPDENNKAIFWLHDRISAARHQRNRHWNDKLVSITSDTTIEVR